MKSTFRKSYRRGLTLVELIVVISILGVLSLMVVPSFIGYVERAKEEVCISNRKQLERIYCTYLFINNLNHSVLTFNLLQQEYDEDICPSQGIISYEDGVVKCSLHRSNENGDEDEEVPYL